MATGTARRRGWRQQRRILRLQLAAILLLCELLKPERVGVELSEEFQLHPEQSTSAIIFHHPEATYFNAG